MTDHIITIEDLSLHIGQRLILSDLELRIPQGSVTALMGPSGGGKSTLLNLLAGKMTADHITMEGTIARRCKDGCPDGWVKLMKQKPTALVRPAVEWLRARVPRCERAKLESKLEEIGAPELVGRLGQSPIEWPLNLRRLLLLAGHILEDPDLLCVDEPCARLDDEEAEPVLRLLERQCGERTILWCTHHQRRARRVSDRVALLAGGRIMEAGPTSQFFDNPKSTAAQDFVRTGSCCVPAPDTPPEYLSDEFRPDSLKDTLSEEEALGTEESVDDRELAPSMEAQKEPAQGIADESSTLEESTEPEEPPSLFSPTRPPEVHHLSTLRSALEESSGCLKRGERIQPPSTSTTTSMPARWRDDDDVEQVEELIFRRSPWEAAWRGPSEFHWMWPGMLAGVAKPGLLRPLRQDLESLQRVGVDALITLNEAPLDEAVVEEMGLEYHHLGIVDMEPPAMDEAFRTCRWTDEMMERGLSVAYHCRAGIGRTGTMLAAQIITTVCSEADTTLRRIRQVLSRYVQSSSQERFLCELSDYVGRRGQNLRSSM